MWIDGWDMGFTRVRTVVALASAVGLNAVFLGVSFMFLFDPVAAVQRFLYPCLSRIEEEQSLDGIAEPVVEGDVIRLAGGLFLAFVVASGGLIVPLLPCCHCENDVQNQKQLRSALLRTLLLLQGTLGLALVGTGLINLAASVEHDEYSDGFGNSTEPTRAHSKSPVHHAQCSSLIDQNVLWLGVGTVVLTSVVMMTSFWPEQRSTEDHFDPLRRPSEGRGCCLRKKRQTVPDLISFVDPLLPDGSSRENDRMDEAMFIEDPGIEVERYDTEQTSRFKGTIRVLKLAGSESTYLWIGVAVLLVRLPFSLAM